MVDAAVALRPDLARGPLDVNVIGKLMEQRRSDGVFYSTILAAAPDEYSAPMPFEVRSRKPLGALESVVTVAARLGGFFRRTYDLQDKNTGEVRRVRPIVATLTAVEA